MWEQTVVEESKRSCENYNGKWKNNLCYRYEVVSQICFYVTEDSNNHDIDDADKWRITRGCYKDGEFTKKASAIPDLRYSFS